MFKRRRGYERDDLVDQLQPLIDDDEFLSSLSSGIDPSEDSDPLAAALLELRADVERPMPDAPDLSDVLGEDTASEGAASKDAADGRFSDRGGSDTGDTDDTDDVDDATTSFAPVVPISKHRSGAHRIDSRLRASNPVVAGLIGAAAATLVIAGSGVALYNVAPGALPGGHSDSDETVVELAGTLDEIESASASGDQDQTRLLLGQARDLVASLKVRERNANEKAAAASSSSSAEAEPKTTTVTTTVSPEPKPSSEEPEPSPEASTVTETATLTSVVTVTPSTTAGGATNNDQLATNTTEPTDEVAGVPGPESPLGF